MSIASKYLIDSNSFITPYQGYYSFDLAPNFWEGLKREILSNSIIMLDKVYEELLKGEDDLSDWLKSITSIELLHHHDAEIIAVYAQILDHLQNCGFYTTKALNEWADAQVADAWIIASAKVNNLTVVTFEKPNNNLSRATPSKRAKIPDVCKHFGVKCAGLYEMMRALSITL